MPKTAAQRKQEQRQRDALEGVFEVRGIRAKKALHPAIKRAAEAVKAKKQAA